MLKITRTELEKKLYREGCNLDFYAMAITPWHLLGVKSFVEKMASEKAEVKGLLFIKYHGQAGFLIKEEDLVFPSNAKIEVVFEERETKSAKSKVKIVKELLTGKIGKKETGHKLYILKPFIPDYELCVKYLINSADDCQPVCIDEGVGTYKSAKELFFEYWRRNKKTGITYAFLRTLDWSLKKKLNRETMYFTLFKNGKGALEENREVSKWYTEILKKNNTQKIEVEDEPYVLIMTQPFELTEDIASKEAINNAYDEVADVLREKGYKIYVKPHPRETEDVIKGYEERGYEIFKVKMPIEALLLSLAKKPEAVIGSLSTSLVTASVLCDVCAISTVDLMTGKVHPAYKETADKFKMRYGKLLKLPKNKEELNFISSLGVKNNG